MRRLASATVATRSSVLRSASRESCSGQTEASRQERAVGYHIEHVVRDASRMSKFTPR